MRATQGIYLRGFRIKKKKNKNSFYTRHLATLLVEIVYSCHAFTIVYRLVLICFNIFFNILLEIVKRY